MSETLIGKAFTNSFSFPGGFVVQADKPIDDRLVVHSVASLTAANTFVSSTDNLLKAYNGMVVSVLETNEIYILTDVANITNINSWKKINVPQASSTDEGKLLTVEKVNVGTTESPVYKYEGRWVDAPSGLPTINGASDANKILQVNAGGTGVAWVEAPEELPTIGTSDANKILQVDASGTGVKWVENTHPKELPPYAGTESGKVLTVSSDGTSTEWSTVNTELMSDVTTAQLYQLVTAGQLKPGMKYRITDYIPAVNPEYTINIYGEECTIGTQPGIGFDIIVTASSESTLFEDVELVAKAGVTTTFDYTKYEAKYDLFGNATSPDPKYAYITSSGTGVIYYMKDQYDNEASYDFENIFYFMPSIPGVYIHTFTGLKSGDLRQYGVINNVRIKNSRQELPGIVFEFANHYNNIAASLYDVELNNCGSIYMSCTNLQHAKISNSKNVSIIMPNDSINIAYNPLFVDLNISDNKDLYIQCLGTDFLPEFNELHGFIIKNLNFLPSYCLRNIDIQRICQQMVNIFRQGIIDTNIISQLIQQYNITPENAGWLLQLLNPEVSDIALNLLFGQRVFNDFKLAEQTYDILVYDAILNTSKNVRPFNIFDGTNWSLEIPHFQSTATSVYELGI